MKEEFDKEIDALLKKAGTSGAAAAPVFDSHLDADEISMFAENAAPEAVKTRMIGHFADCDRCRIILSNVIALNAESPVAEPVAAPVEVVATQQSWLAGLFSTRNLAFGFGTLALLFVGVIGFGVIRNLNSGETQLAQADKSKTAKTVARPAAPASDSNIASNTNVADESGDTQSDVSPAEPAANETLDIRPLNQEVTGKDVARRQTAEKDGLVGSRSDLGRVRASKSKEDFSDDRDNSLAADVVAESAPAPPPAPAKVAAPTPSAITTRGATERKKETDKAEEREENNPGSVAAGATLSDKKQSIGGKSFTQRNGVWYDSSYKNQPTTSVRRGTTAFTNLDSGVRSIANQLPGTVVVVWKTKAYKIQ